MSVALHFLCSFLSLPSARACSWCSSFACSNSPGRITSSSPLLPKTNRFPPIPSPADAKKDGKDAQNDAKVSANKARMLLLSFLLMIVIGLFNKVPSWNRCYRIFVGVTPSLFLALSN
jgi:hypothetical protein